MMSDKITPEHLSRAALVYVRQSSMQQVYHHRESLLCQRSLGERARALGWEKVELIDEDLGVSGTGMVRRTGFETLVARVCREEIGIVFAWDASRLARNNRDWHHLLFLCVHARTLIADQEGVYDPALTNDRLLLGLKGTLGEFELTAFHQRSRHAILQKASRGELNMPVAVGYIQGEGGRLEKHPDQRVQNIISSVFTLFQELGSVRQVALRLCEEKMDVPRTGSGGQGGRILRWRQASYEAVRQILANPIYAGAYAYGRTRKSVRLVEGEPRRMSRAIRNPAEWRVLIRDHHECYITWDEYERNRKLMRESADRFGETVRGSVKGGAALLAGLIRCGKCGARMQVGYGKTKTGAGRYDCLGNTGSRLGPRCQSIGGWLLQEAIERELMRVLEPGAIEAALTGEKLDADTRRDGQRALELEAARFDAQRAHRQYDAVDPENRVVARELERRWNGALEKLAEVERRWTELQERAVEPAYFTQEELLKLAAELRTVWSDPATDVVIKKRIVRCLIQEIIVMRRDEDRTIHAIVHWTGGIHTELTVALWRPGESRRQTSREASEIIRELSAVLPDEKIARVMGLLRHKTTTGLTWTT
ncbi:MAG: recombinase family protein, partial [Candidatus Peregrinibacteria bacterium]